MTIKKLSLTVIITVFLVSCATNDENDPTLFNQIDELTNDSKIVLNDDKLALNAVDFMPNQLATDFNRIITSEPTSITIPNFDNSSEEYIIDDLVLQEEVPDSNFPVLEEYIDNDNLNLEESIDSNPEVLFICNNDTTKIIGCGVNGNGDLRQICTNNTWINDGDCYDPDFCKIGSIQEFSCGHNGVGTIFESCQNDDGVWRWSKHDICQNACSVNSCGQTSDFDCGQCGSGYNCNQNHYCEKNNTPMIEMVLAEKGISHASIILDYDIYVAVYETTFAEFDLLDNSVIDEFGRGDFPVSNVTYHQAIRYANWLSEQHGYDKAYANLGEASEEHVKADITKNGYRLPVINEWMYVVNGGKLGITVGDFCGHKYLYDTGWYKQNSYNEAQTVGQMKPNELGLYDVCGNVSELTDEWAAAPVIISNEGDDIIMVNGSRRYWRGAYNSTDVHIKYFSQGWYNENKGVIGGNKNCGKPELGFRLVRTK